MHGLSRENSTLVAAIVGSAMGFIDGTAVNVALPVIQRELHADAQAGQWVVEGYSLFLSALLLVGGSLGDVIGRRLAFGIGIALFALASLGCAFAPNAGALVAARCVQGAAAALATPGSLALISAAFRGESRGRAIGTWSAFSAMTAALGPVLGGWLVAAGSWRAVFLINLPLALVVLALLTRAAESRDETASRSIDLTGAALVTVGLGAIVYGTIGYEADARPGTALAWIAAGTVALAAFVAVEARSAHPMMPLAVFASRTFSAANAYTFALYAALGGSLYFVPFDLIDVQGYSPAAAGAALLPFIAIMVVFSRFSGGLVTRVGARTPLVLGAVLAAGGFVTYGLAGVGRPYWLTFFPGAVLLGCGGACFVAPLTTTVMNALEAKHAGVASGINNAVSRTAGLVAIAALGVALAAGFHQRFERAIREGHLSVAGRAIAFAHEGELLAGRVPGQFASAGDRRAAVEAARISYASGFEIAMFVSAGLALLAAGIGTNPSFARAPQRSQKPA